MKVMTLVCIILGLPGVGKTLLKNLLLSKPPIPPPLRTSTICAEAPVRIEIRTVTGTRVRNEQGKWKEVDDDGMLDVVATMIFSVESERIVGESTASKAKQKPRKSGSVFSKIVNWIAKRSEKDEATKKGSPQEKSVAVVSVHVASPGSLEACQKAMKKIMDKLVQRINKLRGGEQFADPVSTLPGTSVWVYFTERRKRDPDPFSIYVCMNIIRPHGRIKVGVNQMQWGKNLITKSSPCMDSTSGPSILYLYIKR